MFKPHMQSLDLICCWNVTHMYIILMEADYQSPWLVEYWPAGHSEQLAKPAIRGKGLRTQCHPRFQLNSHAAVSLSDQLSEAGRWRCGMNVWNRHCAIFAAYIVELGTFTEQIC